MLSRYTQTELPVKAWLEANGYTDDLSRALKKCGEEFAELAESVGKYGIEPRKSFAYGHDVMIEVGDVAICLLQIIMQTHDHGVNYAMAIAHQKNVNREQLTGNDD